MRSAALTALVLLSAAALASAQPPAQGIDGIAGRISDIDKQTAELAKQRAALVGDLRTELKRIADVVEKLNLNGPAPVPPVPVDPLRAKLQAAYDADPAPVASRKSQALDLAALYRQAAALAQDATVATAGDLLTRVRDAGKTLVGADALKGIRTVAGAELGALLPTDVPLTADQRTAAAALFAKLASTIEEVAK